MAICTYGTVATLHLVCSFLEARKFDNRKEQHKAIPIIEAIKSDNRVKHVAFADDLSGAGNLASLRRWWDNLAGVSPKL